MSSGVKVKISDFPEILFMLICIAVGWAVWIPMALSSHGFIKVPIPLYVRHIANMAPAISFIIVTVAFKGKEGFKQVAGMLKFRLHPSRYIIATLLPISAATFALAMHLKLGGDFLDPQGWPFYPLTLIVEFVSVLIGQEIALRGYLYEKLKDAFGMRYSGIISAFTVSLFFVIYKLPMFFVRAAVPHTIEYLPWAAWTLAVGILLVWIYESSGKSVIASSLLNASFLASLQVFILNESTSTGTTAMAWWYASAYIILVIILISNGFGLLSERDKVFLNK